MKIRNKIVCGILALAVIGTCAYAACGTNGSTTSEQLVLQPFTPTPENESSSLESESQASIGMTLTVSEILFEDYVEYNVSSEAIKAYTLTAHYAPSYVTMSAQVDWSVSFVNPASEWAVGKTATDYITVTPETDGALTATVECWEGFSSDILITATLRANNAVKADCLCVWIHTDDDGGDNSTGGDSSGDSSSSGNTDSGNTDSGNSGEDSGSSSDNPFETDNRYDEIFEGNIATGYWADRYIEMPIYNGTICLDDEYYQNSDAFGDGKKYFMIDGVVYEESFEFMQADNISATWSEWVSEDGGYAGIMKDSGYSVTAYIGDDDCVYLRVNNTDTGEIEIYRIVGVRANHKIGYNCYNIEYVGTEDSPLG